MAQPLLSPPDGPRCSPRARPGDCCRRAKGSRLAFGQPTAGAGRLGLGADSEPRPGCSFGLRGGVPGALEAERQLPQPARGRAAHRRRESESRLSAALRAACRADLSAGQQSTAPGLKVCPMRSAQSSLRLAGRRPRDWPAGGRVQAALLPSSRPAQSAGSLIAMIVLSKLCRAQKAPFKISGRDGLQSRSRP